MPRLPLSYFEAAVPLPDEWPTRCPCAFLLLSATPYGESAADARAYRRPVIEIDGVQHLAIATNPVPVTEALLDVERFPSCRNAQEAPAPVGVLGTELESPP